MKKPFLMVLLCILVLSDLSLVNMSHFLAYQITNKYLISIDEAVYLQNIWSCNIIWLISAALWRLYTYYGMHPLDRMYKLTIGTISVFLLSFSAYLFFTQSPFPIEFIASLVPIAGIAFVWSRVVAKALRELLPDAVVSAFLAQNSKSEKHTLTSQVT